MVNGVPLENAANKSEETMPLPYCSEPSKAAAEPAIWFGTAARAAALAQAAMMAFMLNITNSGATTPQIPPMFAHTSANNTVEAAKAIRLAITNNLDKAKRDTNFRLRKLNPTMPMMLMPNKNP